MPDDWTLRVRHPARFTLVHPEGAVSGVVEHVHGEADDDLHIRLRLDFPGDALLNDRNHAAQGGALVVELEPWQHGQTSSAPGAEAVNDRKPELWGVLVPHIRAGAWLHIVGPIVQDNSEGHGWIECHSPTNVTLLPPKPAPTPAPQPVEVTHAD